MFYNNLNELENLIDRLLKSNKGVWTMIIGGYNYNFISSYLLYNWKTKKQCVLGNLPGLISSAYPVLILFKIYKTAIN
jgi:hypothetical protein